MFSKKYATNLNETAHAGIRFQ